MKRSNILVSIGDGIDPRSEELRAQSKAIAEAGRSANSAEEVGGQAAWSVYELLLMRC